MPQNQSKRDAGHNIYTPFPDKDKIIAVQEELIKNLQKQVGGLEKQVKELEDWKASSKDRHTKSRQKTKNPTTPHKQMVEYLKKHKPKK